VGEGRQKQVSEIVADQTVARAEPVLEEPAHQRFVFGKRDHAVADVAGRQDAVFAAQAAGTAPVIGYRDDGGEVDDRTLARGVRVVAGDDVQFEAAQQGREAGAAAKCYDTNPSFERLRTVRR